MPTYWSFSQAFFVAAKKAREKLAARKKMKWQKMKDDFARKRTKDSR